MDLFRQRGRVDEENEVKDCTKFKIFRSPMKTELYTDYIAANRFYTDEENASLFDFFGEKLDVSPIFITFAQTLKQMEPASFKLKLTPSEA